MVGPVFEIRKLSFLILFLCIWVSLKYQNAETKNGFSNFTWSSSLNSPLSNPSQSQSQFVSYARQSEVDDSSLLQYDFYHKSCPNAELIIRAVVHRLYKVQPDVVPALLRLVFHDCFIEGCDGSVLLDDADGMDSEKKSPPNESLKGFEIIDIIKSELEAVCPGTVSCSDILVLAARDSVSLAGGPFYPLYTGRRDSSNSFPDLATDELPSPNDDLTRTLFAFTSRGFDERETVSLLGAHSIGTIHCKFFENRLHNFRGAKEPDPSLHKGFLYLLKSKCKRSNKSSAHEGQSSFSSSEPGMAMDYDKPGSAFGSLYYHNLLRGKGILYADQQLTLGEETRNWVRAYASDASLFRRDFALAMMKLSHLKVLTAPLGQIRLNCSKVA